MRVVDAGVSQFSRVIHTDVFVVTSAVGDHTHTSHSISTPENVTLAHVDA